MTTRFAKHSFLAAVLVASGFAGGWWLRGQQAPPVDEAIARQDAVQAPNAARTSAPGGGLEQAVDQASDGHEAAAAAVGTVPPDTVPAANNVREFAALLAAGEFTAAMNIYRETNRLDGDHAQVLKDSVLSHLQRYLREGDAAAMTGLVDAYLAYDYSDLDVLLLLARYHQHSGYPTEAARTFQLAFTYAYDHGERERVDVAFANFVDEVHRNLAGSEGLVAFYESLDLLDLNRPQYRLRLARLYLEQGQPLWGQSLLQELVGEPGVGHDAAQLLAQLEQDNALSAGGAEPDMASGDNVALTAYGSHYHLPLRVNNRDDVHLLIDTGASTTTLSRDAYDRLSRFGGFTPVGPQMFNTANGPTKGTVYRVAQLQIGQQRLRNVDVAVLEMAMPGGVDGLLGMNVLRNFRFEINQDSEQLRLAPRR